MDQSIHLSYQLPLVTIAYVDKSVWMRSQNQEWWDYDVMHLSETSFIISVEFSAIV